jgi:hypothetical protein
LRDAAKNQNNFIKYFKFNVLCGYVTRQSEEK